MYYSIPEYLINQIRVDACSMGSLKGSFTRGEGNMTGLMSQKLFEIIYPEAIFVDTFEFDYLLDGITVDVKGRSLNRDPRPYMDITLPKFDYTCDYFAIFGVRSDYRGGWFIGWLSNETFRRNRIAQVGGGEMPQGGKYRKGGAKILFENITFSLELPWREGA